MYSADDYHFNFFFKIKMCISLNAHYFRLPSNILGQVNTRFLFSISLSVTQKISSIGIKLEPKPTFT